MNDRGSVQWKRISAEGAAIVLSILLAFSIDAWWSDRERSRDEQVLLSTLQVVLENQSDAFSKTKTSAVALRNSVRRLMGSASNPGIVLNDQVLDKLISDLTWVLSSPVTPELTSLLSSENLSLLSNRELQYRLMAIQERLALFEFTVRKDEEFYEQHLMPYLQRHAYLPQINNQFTNEPGLSQSVYPAVQVTLESRKSHQKLLDDIVFQNLLMRRDWRLTDLIEYRDGGTVEDIDSNINEVLKAIESETN